MDLRPILSTLRRHKTAATLIVLEIALSCAIICNAVFLIATRIERMDRDTGMANDTIVRINTAGIGRSDDADAQTRADVQALRLIPGVIAATSTNHVPFDNSSWNSTVSLDLEQTQANLNASVYLGDEQLVETFGLRIIAGRDFSSDEFVDWAALDGPTPQAVPSMLVTRAVAQRLFPDGSALGRSVYAWGDAPIRIVGILDTLIRPNDTGGAAGAEYSVVLPVTAPMGRFALRTTPGRRAEVQAAAVASLKKTRSARVILDAAPFTDRIERHYRQDRAMAWLLSAVCIALLVVTALGIVGLASFWVQQRTKQIGIRRALGATRAQVLRYFQLENLLLATLGIAIGMVLAFGLNQLLMAKYELPRLPLVYLPVGAVALWLLGQLAVLGPARRAASVAPALATRSV